MERFITALTLTNVLVFGTALIGMFTTLGHNDWFMYFWVGAAILNAVIFLIYYRHAHRNTSLTQSRRDLCGIILFVGLPIAPLIYLRRHMFREPHG